MEFTEGTVDVPMAGKVKKLYIVVPAALAAGYVGYRWYQARQDSAAAAAQPSTSDGTYTTPDLSDYGSSTTGGTTTVTGNTGSTTTDGTNGLATNADWTNLALDKLTQQGYDGATVAAALGDFLARRSLTSSEASIARAAIAVAGQPPVGGPFPVNEQATTGGTGTLAAPGHLRKWDNPTDTQIGLQWDPVAGASHYRIYRSGQGEPIGDSVDTKFHAQGLTPNHSYSFHVAALTADGKAGKSSNTYTGHTANRKLAKPTGLHASAITKTSFRVTVKAVPGAEFYRWYVNGKGVSPSDQPYRDFTGMHPNTTYHISVAADLHTQSPGPTSSPISVKTKK
jgi:hypothetical protein